MDDKMQAALMDMMQKMGGIENFQSNPMAFIGEVFKHPEILSQIDALVKTPEMQQEIAASMNNPMFKQILANNPILSGLAHNYGADIHADASDNSENDALDIDDCIDGSDAAIDPKSIELKGWQPVDWLNPPSNQPFFLDEDPSKRTRFNDILAELPEECRDKVTEIANARLARHLDDAHSERLSQIAKSYDLTPLDLIATQGIMGEICYCASLIMPEDDLCDLAKFALASIHRRSGYPVASYLLQVMLYIDSFDDIGDDDWNNFAWSLTSNPETGRDGNFAASWDDATAIAAIAAEQLSESQDTLVAVLLALLNWRELAQDVDRCESPLSDLLGELDNADAYQALLPTLKSVLAGKKFFGLSIDNMRGGLREKLQKDIQIMCGIQK